MSNTEGTETVEVRAEANNGSDVETPGSKDWLQSLYLQRLKEFALPIIGLLFNPADAFDKFAFQRIAALSIDSDKKKEMVQSRPTLNHQIATFFWLVLLKTNFQEILKVERAFIYCNRDHNADDIHAIFGVIADELKREATETFEFLPPRAEGITNDSGANSGLTPTLSTSQAETDLGSQFHKAIMISGTAEGLVKFLKTPAVNHKNVWLTAENDTPLHSAARSPNTRWAEEATQIIMDLIDKDLSQSQFPLKRKELINFQNKQKNTALHLAIEKQSCQLAQCLLDKGADFLVRNEQGVTPLDLMYKKTPEVVLHMLKTAIQPGGKFANDGNLELNIDFRALVGGSSNSLQAVDDQVSNSAQSSTGATDMNIDAADGDIEMQVRRPLNAHQVPVKQKETCPDPNLEMEVLAKMVYENYKSSASVILRHEIVKTFLELKWKILRVPIYILTAIYITMYFSFNIFAIWTFVVKFPDVILESNGTSSEESVSDYENLTFWSYLWGIWLQPATGIGAGDARIDTTDRFLAAVPMLLGIISWCFELFEFYLIKKLTTVTGKCQAHRSCVCKFSFTLIYTLRSYFTSLENILQNFFAIGAVAIALVGIVSEYRLHYWTYWLTAWLVVVSWTLILLQLGNIAGLGKYVQIFKTVIKKFTIVMSIYVCFLVGFSIAFSIIFPQERFATFPMSFFRSISMMAGELNFDEVFDQEKIRPFPFVTQAVFIGFTVTVTIVLINLLTGLAVDDIGKIMEDSDVIHRSIQVERLYVLERMLYKCKDIYVISQEKRKSGDGSTAARKTVISELPRELHPQLRLAYAAAEKNFMHSTFSNIVNAERSAQ